MNLKKNTYVKYYPEFAEEFDITSAAALLFFLIEFFSRNGRGCMYSKKSLALFLRVSEPTIYKLLRELEEMGLIEFGDRTNTNTREIFPTERGTLFIDELNKEFNEPKKSKTPARVHYLN